MELHEPGRPPRPVGASGNAQSGLVGAYADALSDSINYFWDRYILTFGLGDQVALALQAIGGANQLFAFLRGGTRHTLARVLTLRFAMNLVVMVAAVLALIWVIRGRRTLFAELAAHLRALGIEVGATMTMEEALDELRRTRPSAATALDPLIRLYEEEQFSARRDRRRGREIRRGLQQLRA